MKSGRTGETQSRLRLLNLGTVMGSMSAVGALLVAMDTRSWQAAVLLAVGLVTALLVVRQWTVGRYSPLALLALAVTAAVWVAGALAADVPTGVYAFAVVATVIAFEVPRLRWVIAAGTGASAAAIIAVRLAAAGDGPVEVLLRYAVVTPCIATPGVVLTVLAYAVHDVIGELGRAQEREAELAVMRERVRFAGDLHDIQGHTLHVVRLKVALAKRLLEDGHGDPARAGEELDEVHGLVGDTIARTKELAYAQRRLNFSAELENAKNLFEAAGIRVEVERTGEVGARAGEMLGQVLREATTNILRHAEAGHVWITVSGAGITVANDGANGAGKAALGGLAVLRDRLASEGGRLTVEQEDGVFRTAAAFPGAREQGRTTGR
ncbi:sensor histidine kinase [Nocardiopsis suaedae]|uniref:Histidine kinase n=1 Tax=Nocardiopsis suaedae TaxID=3018444 RepID=A0ABT4TH53_9ACTN|nr:histidine kinase [Nocardiopsis suaedae]MDA2804039.1 histidine kinase [Nocardiopsis suaedae]